MNSLIDDIKKFLGVSPYAGGSYQQGRGDFIRDLLETYGDKRVCEAIKEVTAAPSPFDDEILHVLPTPTLTWEQFADYLNGKRKPAEVPLHLYHIRVQTFGDGGRVNTEQYYVRARREPTVNEILTRLHVNLAQIHVSVVDYPIWDLPEEVSP